VATPCHKIDRIGKGSLAGIDVDLREVILGHTILEKTDLYVDCRGHRLLPNPAHPDQTVITIT
jgi:hypothetical protein